MKIQLIYSLVVIIAQTSKQIKQHTKIALKVDR